jgi:hypothetical protein
VAFWFEGHVSDVEDEAQKFDRLQFVQILTVMCVHWADGLTHMKCSHPAIYPFSW